MDIKTFGDLAKVADLCRKKGIKQIKITSEGIEFSLGDKPIKKAKAQNSKDNIDAPPQYTEEDMLFWSSTQMTEVHN